MADEEPTTTPATTTPASTPAVTTATPGATTESTPPTPASEGPKGQPNQEQQIARIVAKALEPISETLATLNQATPAAAEEKPVSQTDIDALNAKHAAESKAWAVEKALMLADCIDTVGALAHVTMDDVVLADDGTLTGIDTQKLKESHPHLFKAAAPAATVSTGATSTGAPASGPAKTIKEGLAALKTQGA